jgi:acetoacetyl-CoA synthetase
MARILHLQGEAVDVLCLLDTYVHQDLPWLERMRQHASRVMLELRRTRAGQVPALLAHKVQSTWDRSHRREPRRASEGLGLQPAQKLVYDRMEDALEAYRPEPYAGGRVVLVRAELQLGTHFDALPVWQSVARGGLDVIPMPDGHLDLVGLNAKPVARALDGLLAGWRLRPVAAGTRGYVRTPYAH